MYQCIVCGNYTYWSDALDSRYCMKFWWYSKLLEVRDDFSKRTTNSMRKDIDHLRVWIPKHRHEWSNEFGIYDMYPKPIIERA